MMEDMWEIFIFKLISENQQFCGDVEIMKPRNSAAGF